MKRKLFSIMIAMLVALSFAACDEGGLPEIPAFETPTGLSIEDGFATWNAVLGAGGVIIFC